MQFRSIFYSFLFSGITVFASANDTLMLAGYDVIRDYYKQYLPVFQAEYQQQYQVKPTIAQSYASASKQAIAVQNGLPADVVTLNQQNDIDGLVNKGLVAADWKQQYPDQATPFHTVMVFLVREGNPKNIHDWQDLTRPDVKVVFANPKTSGNGRYAYLSALGYAEKQLKDQHQINQFIQKFLKNIPVFDTGARAASITFSQRAIGDVLITAENEATLLAQSTIGNEKFTLVYPSISANVPVLVAEVKQNSERHHTQQLAQRFIQSLWQEPAQHIAAKSGFRPNVSAIFAQYQTKFPAINLFDVNQQFGSWQQINQRYFSDGGQFDQLYLRSTP
ncbi:sulfate ABC transporter substrate-binding protein [Gallibacterium melopsittaci]|uniref:Sulfate ABC transporter substrate-binding protein n=1 Tax=Gallibacterium melopsittaci TaxID=516063 RepID=A0ABV6HUC0_9PAST